MRRTVVILAAGATLTVAGCRAGREEPVTSPPTEPAESTEVATPEVVTPEPETIVPEVLNPSDGPVRTVNPPPPTLPTKLPTWEEAESGHPEGATNPPIPVLAISADGTECFKEWYDPRTVPEQARATGGRVLTEGESSGGTPVVCPQERVDALLEQ